MTPIPEDSCLTLWHQQFENTELWSSWRLATGLGIIGAVLGRNVYYSYGAVGRLYPNTSVLLVGPSGDGKDTIIRPAKRILDRVGVQFVAGRTVEAIKTSLFCLGDPAVGYIVAGELKEFLGDKDYQQGLIATITDLLSNNDSVDITTKTDLKEGGKKEIMNPTLTMFAGSTPDWLKEIKSVMSGGFLPRFVVATETGRKPKYVPEPGEYESWQQKRDIEVAAEAWVQAVEGIRDRWTVDAPHAIHQTQPAREYYHNWYENRWGFFSPIMQAYANRAGGLMRKVAMLMAISRGNREIDLPDYEFASDLILHTGQRLEYSVVDVPREVEVGRTILEMLPCPVTYLLKHLSVKFGPMWVKRSIVYLTESGQVRLEGNTLVKEEKGE